MGEPAGIGPEIAVKAWAALDGAIGGRPLFLAGDPEVFREAAALSGIDAARLGAAFFDTGYRARARFGQP